MLEKNCLQCNKTYTLRFKESYKRFENSKVCSLPCRNLYYKQNPNSGAFKKGHKLGVGRIGQKGSANNKWKGGQVSKTCITCSKDFLVDQYRTKSRTCSRDCEQLYRKTEEFRTHLSEVHRSKINPKLKALTQTVNQFRDVLRRCSKYRMWCERIMKRDNFTCQMCEVRGGRLCVDHIKPFIVILFENKIESYEDALKCMELWNINNGRTLCYPCHAKTPTYGSRVWKSLST